MHFDASMVARLAEEALCLQAQLRVEEAIGSIGGLLGGMSLGAERGSLDYLKVH